LKIKGDDIIEGGKFEYVNGNIKVPAEAGLGIKLNRDKLNEYSELYKQIGGYSYDKDPLRPDWSPVVPNNRWADPNDSRVPQL
jgi:glucarate dehydratase